MISIRMLEIRDESISNTLETNLASGKDSFLENEKN